MIEGLGIIYANQLKIVDKSNLKAIVKQSYFKGYYYLIEGDLNGQKVFFEHPIQLEKNAIVYLEINIPTIIPTMS